MKLLEVQEVLEADAAWDADCSDRGVNSCHASDLISDILAFRGPSSLLLTGITNPQVVRAAEILDFDAICFVRGKRPPPETVELAKGKAIPLFVTPLSMYESCGRLYARSLSAGAIREETVDCPPQR